MSLYLDVGNVGHTTSLQALLSFHTLLLPAFPLTHFPACSLVPIDPLLYFPLP